MVFPLAAAVLCGQHQLSDTVLTVDTTLLLCLLAGNTNPHTLTTYTVRPFTNWCCTTWEFITPHPSPPTHTHTPFHHHSETNLMQLAELNISGVDGSGPGSFQPADSTATSSLPFLYLIARGHKEIVSEMVKGGTLPSDGYNTTLWLSCFPVMLDTLIRAMYPFLQITGHPTSWNHTHTTTPVLELFVTPELHLVFNVH